MEKNLDTSISAGQTLHLTLHRKAFEVMVTGEKDIEFRANNTWMKSRLINKGGTVKKYQAIKFVNGYGKDKPYFICQYKGYGWISGVFQYSNGLEVLADNCIGIRCGKILEVGNWPAQ
jgi:hypothetical protein